MNEDCKTAEQRIKEFKLYSEITRISGQRDYLRMQLQQEQRNVQKLLSLCLNLVGAFDIVQNLLENKRSQKDEKDDRCRLDELATNYALIKKIKVELMEMLNHWENQNGDGIKE